MMRSTASCDSPQRHCQIAECSESIGRSSALWRRPSAVRMWPAITSTSLFASATALPALRAASVGFRPAAPTVATTTRSTSGCDAMSSISAQRAGIRSRTYSSSRLAQTNRGRNSCVCSSSSVTLPPAASATTLNRSGSERTASSVWRPMEPVEPRMASRVAFIDRRGEWRSPWARVDCARSPLQHEPYREIVYQRHREEDAVQTIKEASMPGDELACVLYAGASFDEGLCEIADYCDGRQQQ